MTHILLVLINASERAANVARACCQASPEQEGALLVAEKSSGEANARFEHDFKTIADVLAQEAARTEIGSNFPELIEHVRGEECAEIGGVRVSIQKTTEATAELLGYVVPDSAARRMAAAAHLEPKLALCDEIPEDLPEIDHANLGIWIDPIDATSEFIAGVYGKADSGHGLPCVTVLVGAYLRDTGEPVVGVINQPFYNNGQGRILWGVSGANGKRWGGTGLDAELGPKRVLMSSAEKEEIVEKFQNSGWHVKSVPGAGHKLLKVALGEAAMYVVSQGTTYRWDTCAPHAILKSKGGDVLSYTTRQPITYNDPKELDTQMYCNSGGIIAFSEHNVLAQVDDVLN